MHRVLVILLSVRLAPALLASYKLDINATLTTNAVAVQTVPLLKLFGSHETTPAIVCAASAIYM